MTEIVQIKIDWAEAYGWECPFCGGEIDHLEEARDEEGGYADDSYTCQAKGGEMCDCAYFMVRWSTVRKDDNGDALTLSRWIDIEVAERHLSDPYKDSDGERHLAFLKATKSLQDNLRGTLELLESAQSTLDLEGVLSEDFKVQLHWLKGVAKENGVGQ